MILVEWENCTCCSGGHRVGTVDINGSTVTITVNSLAATVSTTNHPDGDAIDMPAGDFIAAYNICLG